MKKLKLNRSVYSEDSIKVALQAYKDFAAITMNDEAHEIVLIFELCRYDEELTVKEFENYLIGVENS